MSADKEKNNENKSKNRIDLDSSWIENALKNKESGAYQEEIQDIKKFFDEFHQLSDFMMAYLRKKYGHLTNNFENLLWVLDSNVFIQRKRDIKSFFKKAINIAIEKYNNLANPTLTHIQNNLNVLVYNHQIHLSERFLQKLLATYPSIIESNLEYQDQEYRLGNTNYRGDLLFLDSNSVKLNVELKVVAPSFNDFTNQMTNYLENIGDKERLMYITPKITLEQEQYCKDNSIEIRIIDLDLMINGG